MRREQWKMGSAHAREREHEAEIELEEALNDPDLSPEERKTIEEQLLIIRKKYNDMLNELLA